MGVAEALGYATNLDLLDEMKSRVDPEAVRLFHGEDGEVSPHFDADEDELAARRGGKGNLDTSSVFTPERSKNESGVPDADDDDGTVRDFDWEPGTYAADSTIDEGKAREERGEDPID